MDKKLLLLTQSSLQLKLNSSKEQLSNLRKQYESAEASQRSLESTIAEIRDELETASRCKEEMAREKDRLIEDLDAATAETFNLEKANQSLKAQVCFNINSLNSSSISTFFCLPLYSLIECF